jgi:hypothetical protein
LKSDAELLSRRIAILQITRERAHDDGVNVWSNSGVQRGWRRHSPAKMGWSSGQRLVEHSAKRIDIHARIQWLRSVLLRRCVMRVTRPERGARVRILDATSGAKIGQHSAAFAQQDVLGSDITVNEALRMNRAERGTNLRGNLNGVNDVERATIPHIRQGVSQGNLEERHNKKEARTILAGVLDRHNVRMCQLTDEHSLASEASDGVWISGVGGGERLDRYLAIGSSLTRAVGLTYVAGSQQLQQLIRANPLAIEGDVSSHHLSRSNF